MICLKSLQIEPFRDVFGAIGGGAMVARVAFFLSFFLRGFSAKNSVFLKENLVRTIYFSKIGVFLGLFQKITPLL